MGVEEIAIGPDTFVQPNGGVEVQTVVVDVGPERRRTSTPGRPPSPGPVPVVRPGPLRDPMESPDPFKHCGTRTNIQEHYFLDWARDHGHAPTPQLGFAQGSAHRRTPRPKRASPGCRDGAIAPCTGGTSSNEGVVLSRGPETRAGGGHRSGYQHPAASTFPPETGGRRMVFSSVVASLAGANVRLRKTQSGLRAPAASFTTTPRVPAGTLSTNTRFDSRYWVTTM
jgi:hypothetical protein